MDIADASDESIIAAVAIGVVRAQEALKTRKLLPIGVCHYCESPVRPGTLFCEADKDEPEHSCSVEWEYIQQRQRENGR